MWKGCGYRVSNLAVYFGNEWGWVENSDGKPLEISGGVVGGK